MTDNVTDFMAHRAKTTAAVPKDGETVDVDAVFAKSGLDRAAVDAIFANHVTNEEEQAPAVARCREMLEGNRELLTLTQEMAAKAQADLARLIKAEREIKDQLTIEQCKYLCKIARGDGDKTNEATGKPKRKRSRR